MRRLPDKDWKIKDRKRDRPTGVATPDNILLLGSSIPEYVGLDQVE